MRAKSLLHQLIEQRKKRVQYYFYCPKCKKLQQNWIEEGNEPYRATLSIDPFGHTYFSDYEPFDHEPKFQECPNCGEKLEPDIIKVEKLDSDIILESSKKLSSIDIYHIMKSLGLKEVIHGKWIYTLKNSEHTEGDKNA